MSQQEGRITLAIQSYRQGHFSSLKAAAIDFDVSYSTIRRRIQGVPARRDSQPANKKLADLEESTLEEWILSMADRGLPLRAESIRHMANLLLQKRPGTSQNDLVTVGQRLQLCTTPRFLTIEIYT
jgi:transposase